MPSNKYQPHSHFFVDHTNLDTPDLSASANDAIYTTDAFGPVKGDETNQYRITSFVRASTNSKVFAVCDGHILIQPYDGDTSKVNLILKPTASYSPFKIKYFIYRGVDMSDLIFGPNIAAQTTDSPEFIKRVWKASSDLAQALNEPIPSNLAAQFIGYDPGVTNDELLSHVFLGGGTVNFNLYNIPKCFKGELIGNFTGKIGLDIVLDYGDYEMDYEEQLFKLNLEYARKSEHIFDLSTVTGSVKQKRYKEYIHQFIDAAAFWGSHINYGEITLFNDSLPKTSIIDVYEKVVCKYQTKNKLYFHVKSERGRSYNFYSSEVEYMYPNGEVTFDVYGTNPPNIVAYDTDGWPIIIKVETTSTLGMQSSAEFDIDTDTLLPLGNVLKKLDPDINVVSYATQVASRESFVHASRLLTGQSTLSGQTNVGPQSILYPLKVYTSGASPISVAEFYFLNHMGILNNPIKKYYEDLWVVNNKNTFQLPPDINCEWSTNYYERLINLYPIIHLRDTRLQQKTIRDKGRNSSGVIKNRILYVAAIDATNEAIEKTPKLNGDVSPSSFDNILSKEQYYQTIYNDSSFKVFKGKINDGSDISSLALINTEDYELKKRFFQIGITEEEYNKIIYDSATVPSPIPATPHISATESANIHIHLETLTTISSSKGFKKFKLGIKFENSTGGIEIKFPSAANQVEIYTIDGFYFFSKDYTDHQEFFEEFSAANIQFRPTSSWIGEFGFDWLRIGDSGLPADSITPVNRKTLENLGHYYTTSSYTKKDPADGNSSNYLIEKEEFFAYKNRYKSYALNQVAESEYVVPWLALYPSLDSAGTSSGFPKSAQTSGNFKCLVECRLNLKINANALTTNLKVKFEKEHFLIVPVVSAEMSSLPDSTDSVTGITYGLLEVNQVSGSYPATVEINITALKEFDDIQRIEVIAKESGVESLAGELFVYPNSKKHRKEIQEVVLVDCKTDLTTPNIFSFGLDSAITPIHKNRIGDEIVKSLNQSLIDVKTITVVILDITRSQQPSFYTKYDTYAPKTFPTFNNDKILYPNVVHSDLTAMVSLGTDKAVVFCINEYCAEDLTGSFIKINGEVEGINIPVMILYKSGLYRSHTTSLNGNGVAPHEFLHGLGAFHTFSNYNDFTHKQYITDNIMDYEDSSISPSTKRISLFKYQWDIINQNKIVGNEI